MTRRGGEKASRGAAASTPGHAEPQRSISVSLISNAEILRSAQDDERAENAEGAEAAQPDVIPTKEESVLVRRSTRGQEHGFLAAARNDGVGAAPTEEEAAAIVAALLLFESIAEPAAEPEPVSAWAIAGRHATHLGRERGAATGWGRARAERRR
jgi:hypothetical protein